jgi:hypothetical protein
MAASTTTTADMKADPAQERNALSPEVSHFLVQLSIGLHKTGTYPADHPALESAIQSLTLRLERLLAIRQAVQIGVARDRLLIEGGSTDPSNAVLRSLAEALHRHQIGSIRFDRGASPAEVSAMLHELSKDGRRSEPLGSRDAEALGQWPHIRLAPVALDQLQLAGDGTAAASSLDGLWLLLAHATLQGAGDIGAADRPPADLAEAIRSNVRDSSYDRVIADYMSRVGQELVRHGGSSSTVALRLGDLIQEVGDDTLRLLLDLGSDMATRQQLVRDLSRVLPARSVIALTRAAADASRESISHPLLRLFGKMAANSEAAPGPVSTSADSALRDGITQLVDGWTLANPNPEAYRDVLRQLSTSQRNTVIAHESDPWTDAIRIVDIALETDAIGPAIWRAVNELIRLGRLDDLLESLEEAREGQASRQIKAHLAKPEQIGALLQSRQSRRAVEQLLRWTGVEAADALLDGLEATDSRAARRRIIERLVRMGAAISDRVVERLDKGPWFVQRNMLYLLSEMAEIPAGFDPGRWLLHEDSRVRREAVRVALRVPETRAAAIAAGLREDDTRILNQSLSVALGQCPPGIAPALIDLLDNPATDPGVRIVAVRVLGRTRTVEARRWLLQSVLEKTGWWRRPALVAKSQEMLIALSALRQWRTNRDVASALALARYSDDVEVRFAATASTTDWL